MQTTKTQIRLRGSEFSLAAHLERFLRCVSYYTFLLFLFIFCIKLALECYHCDQAVMNFTECNTTRVCNKGEVGMDEIRAFMHLNTVELQ